VNSTDKISRWGVLPVAITILSAAGCAGARQDVEASLAPEDSVANGYVSVGRNSVTSAISSVTEGELSDVRVSQMGELLWGRVPGLEVSRRADGSFALRIRGPSSLIGGEEPLIILNGVPLVASRDLRSINPKDVARVDVLKDASSTAIYGSRGANGVIVITTKRP
jgi:TonB-dependent SusC/RagA subfamily outer membrane receptor